MKDANGVSFEPGQSVRVVKFDGEIIVGEVISLSAERHYYPYIIVQWAHENGLACNFRRGTFYTRHTHIEVQA